MGRHGLHALALSALAACALRVTGEPPPDAGPDAPAQCLCPDAPGYAPCVKPLECCPVVGVCKNPASFNCTGSGKTCP